MVASSSGIGQVAKKIVDQGLEAQVRFSWKQVDASEVQAPLRSLAFPVTFVRFQLWTCSCQHVPTIAN